VNVLIVGGGQGSWQVRGVQLGNAIGARLETSPIDHLRWADVVVCVKRALFPHAEAIHRAGKPLVWDALDFWTQPEQNSLSETEARALLQQTIAKYRPTLTIGATQAMADAAGGVYLPHHARPGLTPGPVREQMKVVGYEGTRKYLGSWGKAVQYECDRRGLSFVINPPDLRKCDLLVAFRDAEHDGWMCREWKSGVKIVNARAAGRPIVTQWSAAAQEIRALKTIVHDQADLSLAIDEWDYVARKTVACGAIGSDRFALDQIARQYRNILSSVSLRPSVLMSVSA
jgi:hypothetical protein